MLSETEGTPVLRGSSNTDLSEWMAGKLDGMTKAATEAGR